jgi:hypothetical protein
MNLVRLSNEPRNRMVDRKTAGLPSGEDQDAFLPSGGAGAMTCGQAREAMGVFQDEPSLEAAVDDLLMSGFDRSEISVLVGRRRVGPEAPSTAPEAASTTYVGNDARTQAKAAIVAGFGYFGAMAAVYLVISSGGTVTAAAVVAIIAGTVGGSTGGAVSLLLDRRHAECVHQQLVCGGLRLWVHTADRDSETRACQILTCQAARNIRVQDAVQTGLKFRAA